MGQVSISLIPSRIEAESLFQSLLRRAQRLWNERSALRHRPFPRLPQSARTPKHVIDFGDSLENVAPAGSGNAGSPCRVQTRGGIALDSAFAPWIDQQASARFDRVHARRDCR